MRKVWFVLLFPFLSLWGRFPEKKEIEVVEENAVKQKVVLRITSIHLFTSTDYVILAK